MATYEFTSLLNTTDGMTQVNDSTVQSKTLEVEGTTWYHYAGNTVSKLYINGKGYIGFGADTEHLQMFCATSAMNIYEVYRQEGSLSTGTKFLKLRIKGEYYRSSSSKYAYEYEVFLFDDGNIFVYIIKIAKDKYDNLYGDCKITDGKTVKTILLGYDSDAKTPPTSRLISNAGIKMTVARSKYIPIKETGARVKTNPPTVYLPNELDWSELAVESYDASGNTNVVSNFIIPDVDVSTAETKTVNLSYKTYNLPVEIVVKEDTVSELTNINLRDHYLLNESLEVRSVTAVWESGKSETLTSGFDVFRFDSATPGTKELTISYKGVTATKNIYVAATATLTVDDAKTEYYIGDEFGSVSGIITYDDGKEERAYSLECSGFDNTLVGEQVITATVRGLSTTYTVNVSDTVSVSIGSNVETDVTVSLNLITGLLTISGTGDTKSINAPSYWGGGILNDQGKYSSKVKKIVVQEGITGLIGACFYGMSNVTEVSLPSTLKTIGSGCFNGCSLITTLVLPEGLEALQSNCFLNCGKLTELTIPESLITIGASTINNSNMVLTVLSRTVQFDNYAINTAKTIRGYIGSTAEIYANSKNIEFAALNKLASVSIKDEPYTKEYWPLEEISTSGLILEITDEDGVSTDIDTGFEITTPDMETPGEKDVVVTYKGYTNAYKITVAALILDDILKNSDKMKQNNTLSIPWFMFDNAPCEKVVCTSKGKISFSGTAKIDVMCDGNRNNNDNYDASATYTLETILSNGIRVAKFKSSGKFSGYYREGSFGFEIFFFSTGDIYILINGTTGNDIFSGWNGTLKSGGNTYTVYGCASATKTYQTLSAYTSCYHLDSTGSTWDVKSEAYSFSSGPKEVRVSKLPSKIDYMVNDVFDLSGMEVLLIYADGSSKVLDDYTLNTPDMATAGIKEVIVTDTKSTISALPFNIYVNISENVGYPVEESVIATSELKNKKIIVSGDGVIKDYSSGTMMSSIKDLIECVELSENITEIGNSAFVSYKNLKNVVGIGNIFRIGDYSFLGSGLEGELSLKSISTIGTSAFYKTKITKINIGPNVKQINRAFSECDSLTQIFLRKPENSVSGAPWGAPNATVVWDATLSQIKITPPLKLKYFKGDDLDTNGLVVTAIYSTGETKVITDYSLSGYDKNTIGTQIITVSYLDKTSSFKVTVVSISDITISNLLAKLEYYVNDDLDSTGLAILVRYSDGTSEAITTGFELSGFDSSSVGEKTITVTYKTHTASFKVNVYKASGIRISRFPAKTFYKIGEPLDLTGLSVNLIRNDGSEKTLTDYSVSGFDSSKVGIKPITVSCNMMVNGTNTFIGSDSFQIKVTNDGQNPFDSSIGSDSTGETKENTPVYVTVHWIDGEFEDLTHENGGIKANTFVLQESICSEPYFIFGGCISNQVTFETGHKQFWGTDEDSYPSGRIEVYLECNKTKVKVFTGRIASAERTSIHSTRKIVAYDYLYDLRNTDIARWYKNQTTDKKKKLTQRQFRDKLFEFLGLEQVSTKLHWDDTYVPDTNNANEMNAVNILKDLCLQNNRFGWMNRDGKFEYLKLRQNSHKTGETTTGKKIYQYYDNAEVHLDTFKSFWAKEGRIWFPHTILTDPDPNRALGFTQGEPTAQEAYENNVFYNRNSFFVGNEDWMDYVWNADEYGGISRAEPIINICYGTFVNQDLKKYYRAQAYTVEVIGNPLNTVGQTIELLNTKQMEDGTELEWYVHSYIMNRTLKLGNSQLIDTYSANNAPFNSNSRQLGKDTPEISATVNRTRSEMPVVSYEEFTDGTDEFTPAAVDAPGSSTTKKTKKVAMRCMKQIKKEDYDNLPDAIKTRKDTVFMTYKEI